jgi:putative ABC transport system ATP-binding protein
MNDLASASPLLSVRNVTKLYADGQVRALADVSLEIRRGEYVAIMGKSGSGKSTLLNILSGLDLPTAGEVQFDGCPLGRLPSLDNYRRDKIGIIFQSFHLVPVLTALENVQVPMMETDLKSARRRERARELLAIVGLEHRQTHLPKALSIGERQRVAIARALANEPALLLADEPTGNLDSVTAQGIMELFDNLHRQRGMTLVVVTHDSVLAERTERVIHLHDGRVVDGDEN